MPKKRYAVIAKPNLVSSGINSATKAQLKRIQTQELDKSLPTVKYSDVYVYSKQQWTYKGKSCMLCDKVMNDPIVLENHHYVCGVNIQKHKSTSAD
jgi:hypothetical protein